jgi:hypothetical protein
MKLRALFVLVIAFAIVAGKDGIVKKDDATSEDVPAARNGLMNIAPYAVVTSVPYCGTLQYLTDGEAPKSAGGSTADGGGIYEMAESQADGSIETFACFPLKSTRQEIVFRFSEPIAIEAVNFQQRSMYAKSFRIEGDSGSGSFDVLADEKGTGKPDIWNRVSCGGKTVRAIRFLCTENAPRPTGLMIGEFEVLVKEDAARPFIEHMNAAKRSLRKAISRAVDGDLLSMPVPVRQPKEKRLQLGVFGCLWMFIDDVNVLSNGVRISSVNAVTSLDFDRIRLSASLRPSIQFQNMITLPEEPRFRERIAMTNKKTAQGGFGKPFPLPSKVIVGWKENILKLFSAEMKKYNVSVTPIPPRNVHPFDTRSGYFPMAQADRHDENPEFPCVWYGDWWKPAFTQLLREITRSDVGGVDIMPDEFYVEGHDLMRLPVDDPCRKKFKEQYGMDVPPGQSDTEQYRKWVLFQYQSSAQTFTDFVAAVKEESSAVETECNISVAPIIDYKASGFTIAYDMIGHNAGMDRFGTDPYYRADNLGHYQMPKTSALFQGATPSREISMLLQSVCGDFKTPLQDPVWSFGNNTSVLFQGVKNIDFYRLDYFASLNPAKENPANRAYKQWVTMVRNLESFGLKAAKKPRDIAFVYSRAGVDWWELTEMVKADAVRKNHYPHEAMAGYNSHDAAMKMLFMNGRPFELFYIDQPTTLARISEYKVVVIPFGYSVSKAAFAVIKSALTKGVRFVIIGHTGETDEFGNQHDTPLLKQLIGKPGVTYIDRDLSLSGTEPEAEREIIAAIDGSLGKERSFFANTYGADIECGMLENSENRVRFIAAVNWHNRDADIDIGMKLPPGKYEMTKWCIDGYGPMTIDGRKIMTAHDISLFRIHIKKHDTSVLVVKPAL